MADNRRRLSSDIGPAISRLAEDRRVRALEQFLKQHSRSINTSEPSRRAWDWAQPSSVPTELELLLNRINELPPEELAKIECRLQEKIEQCERELESFVGIRRGSAEGELKAGAGTAGSCMRRGPMRRQFRSQFLREIQVIVNNVDQRIRKESIILSKSKPHNKTRREATMFT